jgi:polysaccharide pyruvyl transferase WcaK-like protein
MGEIEQGRNEVNMKEHKRQPKRIALFGNFNSINFGNESTLQAMLYNLRNFEPDAEVFCISTGPVAALSTHHIQAIPADGRLIESWNPRNLLSRALRGICIGLPNEAYRWVKGFVKLRRTDMLIIPGTGLLTDAYGLFGWGPYTLFRWSLIAKICRCKLLLVSVGAGPVYSQLGRLFVRLILSLADFRSYRDDSTLQYLASIGFRADNDQVSPDLAFSLPEAVIPGGDADKNHRRVVGLGVMAYAGKYSIANPTDEIYLAYLENLVVFTEWLLARGYDVRLLIGDLWDTDATNQFRTLLSERMSPGDEKHVIETPIRSVDDLLWEIATTDLVVATRFHNVLLSLFCVKPVISISFHHKCESLMDAMGLSKYCLNINDLKSDQLIKRFCDVEANSENIKICISNKTQKFREALDKQYRAIFRETSKHDIFDRQASGSGGML